MKGARAWMCVLAVASGCARNAIFELEIDLPPSPDGTSLFASVQARNDESFDRPWEDAPLDGIALAASCSRPDPPPPCADRMLDPSCSAVVSVVGDGGDVGSPLRVRIRFCADPTCAAPEDAGAPEHRAEIERAFYVGRYTQARVCIDTVPDSVGTERIERCEVRCRDGTAALHCRLDGTHFCE